MTSDEVGKEILTKMTGIRNNGVIDGVQAINEHQLREQLSMQHITITQFKNGLKKLIHNGGKMHRQETDQGVFYRLGPKPFTGARITEQ